ncbi:MAG: hypothetical protein L3J84_05990 [Gammaproteobacteria bacterium]|nr:hypothetical protein [Gammaproteobacteria bacterium]
MDDIATTEEIWQIGSFGRVKHQPVGDWVSVFDYAIQKDPDPVNKPTMPRYMSLANSRYRYANTCEKLRIHFSVEDSYEDVNFLLPNARNLRRYRIYARLSVNGESPMNVTTDSVPLGSLTAGDHVLELSMTGSYRNVVELRIMSLEGVKAELDADGNILS